MSKPEKAVRFSVSLPHRLLKDLDRRMIARGYSSRSEFVRDLIRGQLVQEKWQDRDAEVVGVLTILYDHHQRDLPERVMEIQHHSYVHVLCNTHVHLDHDDCLEAIFIQGKPSEVEKLSLAISGLRGVKFAKLTRASKVSA